ncbi:hypothetical protein BHM03_00052702 [Ensete ventricosum]|nr:hypothetical protein BHM03_00052702 [Ensete ventricosum]
MPPLWANAIPKGGASVGATPAGTSDAQGRLLLLAVALPLAALAVCGHPCRALAVASHLCRWHGHGWLPLLITFTAKT